MDDWTPAMLEGAANSTGDDYGDDVLARACWYHYNLQKKAG